MRGLAAKEMFSCTLFGLVETPCWIVIHPILGSKQHMNSIVFRALRN